MRNDEMNKDDVLRQYINARNIRKAPEGFSSKVMSHIYTEAKPVKRQKTYLVPLVFASVFLVLALAALFIPHSSFTMPEIKLLENVNILLPELDMGKNVPSIITYVVAGVAGIAVFDSGLNMFFRKNKN